MLIDSRKLNTHELISADIVIVGAGAAGLVLARELRDAGHSVCLLESGGEHPCEEVTDLSRGRAVIAGPDGVERPCDDYLHTSRERGLGGTLNLWGGKCAELDVADFERRDWIEHSGWPFSKADLQPYYDRACHRFGIPPLARRKKDIDAAGACPRLNGERNFSTAIRVFSGVTGTAPGEGLHAFKYDVADDPRIPVYLRATVTEIVLDANATAVTALRIALPDGRSLRALGRSYILAAGGLENARLLLASDGAHPDGVGNAAGLVGRFFSGHGILRQINGLDRPPATLKPAAAIVPRLEPYLHKDPAYPQAILVSGRGLQRRELLPGFSATFEPVGDPRRPSAVPVFFGIEQIPNPDSRVSLDDSRDALGCQRVRLEWRFLASDVDALGASIAHLARDLAKDGWGELDYDPARIQLVPILELARHHMGTTRMHDDPSCGVVDADCRVHGLANLYVAGASVFPTSGLANPTLTLAALAIRLADHLGRTMKRGGSVDAKFVADAMLSHGAQDR